MKVLLISNQTLPHIEESNSFIEALRTDGISADLFIFGKKNNKTRDMGFLKLLRLLDPRPSLKLIKKVKTCSITSIVLTAPIPSMLIVAPVLKFLNVRIIYTFHEPSMPERKDIYYKFTNLYHFFLLPFIEHIIFYSKFSLKLHQENTKNQNISYSLLPLYKYRNFKKTVTSIENRKYISFIGNLGSNKDISLFLKLASLMPDSEFLIAGSGDLNPYIKEINNLENLRVENRYLSEDDYFMHIDNSLLVLLPYKTASQSGVLLDVMCRGSVAVCSDIPAFRELISNGKNGFLFKHDEFLLQFMKKFPELKNDEIISISKNALNYYNNNFNRDAFYKKLKSSNINW